jgi:hypothetical protein
MLSWCTVPVMQTGTGNNHKTSRPGSKLNIMVKLTYYAHADSFFRLVKLLITLKKGALCRAHQYSPIPVIYFCSKGLKEEKGHASSKLTSPMTWRALLNVNPAEKNIYVYKYCISTKKRFFNSRNQFSGSVLIIFWDGSGPSELFLKVIDPDIAPGSVLDPKLFSSDPDSDPICVRVLDPDSDPDPLWLIKSYGSSFGSDHKYSFFHNAKNKKSHFHGILKHTGTLKKVRLRFF